MNEHLCVFAEVVQVGPRLWAKIHDDFARDDEQVLRTINLFDSAQKARDWGFIVAPSPTEDFHPKVVAQAMADISSRVPVEMAAFRRGGEKRLGPYVSQLLTTPALPTIRDASPAEIWYLWMLVPYDLDEPIFVIESGKTRVLVNLDKQHKIMWLDLLPDTL